MSFFGLSHVVTVLLDTNVFLLGLTLVTGTSLFFLIKWFGGGWCWSKALLHGKTAIVTGSNAGIGKETARDLARRGARVIMACRNLEKAESAALEIKESCREAEIIVRHLDTSSFKSIRKFAKEILETESQINILVNNAGIVGEKGWTEDGYDLTFGTNHLGPFLLTNLLLPKIKESAPARIVNVSSLLHRIASIDWDDINMNKPGNYNYFKAYGQSKLANIYFTRELARRLQNTGVTTYAVHPGYVATYLTDHFVTYFPTVMTKLSNWFANLYRKTPIQGAQTSIYCAVSEEVSDHSGLYYSDCSVARYTEIGRNGPAERKLWDISVEMVKLEEQ